MNFANTPKRIEELVQTSETFLKTKKMTTKESQKLRGRMQFADSQLFGRVGRLCMRAVTNHGFSGGGPKISSECVSALDRFQTPVGTSQASSRLRNLRIGPGSFLLTLVMSQQQPNGSVGLGGVIYDPAGCLVQSFSISLNDSQIKAFGGDQKSTIILEAELLALVVAASLWQPLFGGCPTVFYVDNNSARDVAISGCGRSAVANDLLELPARCRDELWGFCIVQSYPFAIKIPLMSLLGDQTFG